MTTTIIATVSNPIMMSVSLNVPLNDVIDDTTSEALKSCFHVH